MRKTILTLTATTLAMTGGIALAQQRGMADGPVTLAEAKAKAAERFARMDANNDGVLNAEDRTARRAQRFAQADTNGDGELSRAEMVAAREARQAQRAERRETRMDRRFARLDADNSGGVSQAEMAAAREARQEARGERRGRGGPGMRRGGRMGGTGAMRAMMRRANTDNDRAISRSEFDAAVEARFARADANGDGTVTVEERRAARDKMREQRRGMRGQ